MDNQEFENPLAVCLMGPTACGKTDLAISLTQHLPIEIINVDSAQIYQGLDIGSGKPSRAIREQIPHHLMDFLDPKIPYSAAQFRMHAQALMQEIHLRGNIPVLVGGTMLYFKVLQEGMSNLPDANPSIRASIEAIASQEGWAALYQKLENDDPLTASCIKPNDTQRIQRALEILEITGKPKSYWLALPKQHDLKHFRFLNIALLPLESLRSVLHERISLRFDAMLSHGLIDEVEKLKRRGDLDTSLPSIRAVGYRQAWQYLSGEITYDDMREKAIAATRQLAKRQLTWLRQWTGLNQFDFQDPEILFKVLALIGEA